MLRSWLHVTVGRQPIGNVLPGVQDPLADPRADGTPSQLVPTVQGARVDAQLFGDLRWRQVIRQQTRILVCFLHFITFLSLRDGHEPPFMCAK